MEILRFDNWFSTSFRFPEEKFLHFLNINPLARDFTLSRALINSSKLLSRDRNFWSKNFRSELKFHYRPSPCPRTLPVQLFPPLFSPPPPLISTPPPLLKIETRFQPRIPFKLSYKRIVFSPSLCPSRHPLPPRIVDNGALVHRPLRKKFRLLRFLLPLIVRTRCWRCSIGSSLMFRPLETLHPFV